MTQSSQTELRMLTDAVWSASEGGDCPPDKYPSFRQLDNLITTTAWGLEAREEFFLRWQTLQPDHNATIEVGGSISELAHLLWTEAAEKDPRLKHRSRHSLRPGNRDRSRSRPSETSQEVSGATRLPPVSRCAKARI